MQETPEVLDESDDLMESDSDDEEFYTPTLSLSDLYGNVPQRTVSSESVDSFHSAFSSVSDLLEDLEDDEYFMYGEFTSMILKSVPLFSKHCSSYPDKNMYGETQASEVCLCSDIKESSIST